MGYYIHSSVAKAWRRESFVQGTAIGGLLGVLYCLYQQWKNEQEQKKEAMNADN